MCPTEVKFKHREKTERKEETAPSQNRWWNILAFFSSVLPAAVNPLFLLAPFWNKKAESAVRQSLPTFSSERLHVFFPPSLAFGLLVSSTFVRHNNYPKSVGLVQKLARLTDVSVEWAVGQSERCHSSLLSPVWVCIWGTGTTHATAANKGPLSGSACCTRWHQLSRPTSSSKHTMRGREGYHTHIHGHSPRGIQTTAHQHPNFNPTYEIEDPEVSFKTLTEV